jgi:hypothetical protein
MPAGDKPTEKQVQAFYLKAVGILFDIGANPNAPARARTAAREAVKLLSRDFVNVNLSDLSLRTKQVELFVEKMEAVIRAAQGATPLTAVTKLGGLAKAARESVE